jgi:hypothetical protein
MEIFFGGRPVLICLKIIAVNGRVLVKPGFCLSGSQLEKSVVDDLRVTAVLYACACQAVWSLYPKINVLL